MFKPQNENWKLRDPRDAGLRLSQQQNEWLEWALSGADEVLDDDAWLADNDDALTVDGQIADMQYRLETQGEAVAENNCNGDSESVIAGRCRSLRSLARKLTAAGYFDSDYHATEKAVTK